MKTLIVDLDLSKQPPHSPRARIGGFALACRAVDKCRASLAGTPGEYHFDCALDQQLFRFKGITSGEFKAAVKVAKNYDEVGTWLLEHGQLKTGPEIEDWSEDQEGDSLMKDPEKRAYFVEDCHEWRLDKVTSFCGICCGA
jgi:hypothetical protein